MPFMGMYNSTKAAVNNISDTLRIELDPFDVKVVNVSTGLDININNMLDTK